jgi:hypothetical protein
MQEKKIVILPSEDARRRYIVQHMVRPTDTIEQLIAELSMIEFVIDQKKYDEQCDAEFMSTDTTTIRIEHPGRDRYGDLTPLFEGVTTVGKSVQKFLRNMKKAGENYANSLNPTDAHQRNRYYNNYVGDVFEVFVEYLVKTRGTDTRIGIVNYRPIHVTGEKDYGVDGYGVGINGKPATLQIKYRSLFYGVDGKYVLTANEDHLVNFKDRSHEIHNVDYNDTNNMLVITTASEVAHTTKVHMLHNKVRFIFLQGLEAMLDNNPMFWNDFRRMIQPRVVPMVAATVQAS